MRQNLLNYLYRQHCIEERRTVILEGERSAPAQSHEWESLDKEREVAGSADYLHGGRLEVATEGERTGPKLCFSFAKLAVRFDDKKWMK